MKRRPPDLDKQLDRLERVLPRFLSVVVSGLRAPHLRWARFIVGVLFIIGSFFWFLPILGIEMLPIGLALIAIDIPALRGPVARMIDAAERLVKRIILWWRMRKARRQHRKLPRV